jgi:tetratricopeptide (TPR) repeat protein
MGCGASEPTASSLSSPLKQVITPTSVSATARMPSNSMIGKRNRLRAQPHEIVQNILLIWLDEKIDESIADYSNAIKQLRHTVNVVETFRDTDECTNYISQFKNEKALFLIVSGAVCESVMPRIHSMPQIHSIYVFCRQQSKYEKWATKDWPKVKGIFTEINTICDLLQQSARQCDDDAVVISGVSSFNQIEPSFMYTQLFKEILLEIKFDEKKDISDLADYVRKQKDYADNEKQLAIIDEFARDYKGNVKNKPIWWYSRECFTYQLVNKALRSLQVETLLKMGFFIRDLHENIKKLHAEQINDKPITTVFRGQTMTKVDFKSKIHEGGLVSFNNFLSTSDDRKVAIHFIKQGLTFDNTKIGVLFIMKIGRSITSTPFARIDKFSFFGTENEILFSMHTVFCVKQIKEIQDSGATIHQVELTLTNDSDDQQLNALTEHMRKQIMGKGWERMAILLWKMGENDKAEQVCMLLLQQESDGSDKAYYYILLGSIKDGQGDYRKAIEFYEQSLNINEKILPPNDPRLATAYNNIGMVYRKIGEYSKALSLFERSLEIMEIALPPDHPVLATFYNNIGMVYDNMDEYSKALSSYERSLEIRKKALPPSHPDLAASYDNIGAVYRNMDEYSKALSSFERALKIRKIALPPNHPDLAASYSNIGVVYNNMDEYSKALSSYERSLEIMKIALPLNHPDLATFYNNIAGVYVNMDEYSKALSYYEKALEIFENSLPSNHPHIASVNECIEFVKQNMLID